MSTDKGELKIENTNINTAPGVELSSHQKTIVGSVLDLFAGRPSLAKLQLWKDDATFSDNITIAEGRAKYEPQWYGLQTAFSEIERLHHEVTSSGNPIEMKMKTRYVVKGINKEQTIDSHINIYTDGDKISKVEDKWDGSMSDGAVANVSSFLLVSNTMRGWHFALGPVDPLLSSSIARHECASTMLIVLIVLWQLLTSCRHQALRKLNAMSVPKMVGVPKDAEEDRQKGNQ